MKIRIVILHHSQTMMIVTKTYGSMMNIQRNPWGIDGPSKKNLTTLELKYEL